MHYYKFHIGDYRRDTGHLSMLEHGIYRTLIDWHYLDEAPIPLETQSVMRRLRLGSGDEQSLANVLADFFEKTDEGYIQKRVLLDVQEYHGTVAKNQANGRHGGRPPKTQSVPSGLPKESQSNPNHKPVTNNHKPVTKINTAPEGVSQEVWDSFLTTRKALRAAVTPVAVKRIQTEADKAGWSLEDALAECCARGWRGFKADWVATSKPTNIEERKKAAISGLTRGLMGGTNNVRLIG